MANQLDYIVATGIFLSVIGYIFLFTTNYLESTQEDVKLSHLRLQSMSMLELKDMDIVSNHYTFWIILINNQSHMLGESILNNFENELVEINFTRLGLDVSKINSTIIYNGTEQISYNYTSDRILFVTAINQNEVKRFFVRITQSNITFSPVSILGYKNNITETFTLPWTSEAITYKSVQNINNYTTLKNYIGADRFHMDLYFNNTKILDFGDTLPKEGDIISLRKFYMVQNSTGAWERGYVVIQTW